MSKSAAQQKQPADQPDDAAAPSAPAQKREDISADTNRRILETINVVAGMHGSEKAAILLLALGEEAKPVNWLGSKVFQRQIGRPQVD